MEKAYAQALWKILEGGTTPSKAVRGLKEKLERDGRVALLPKIGRAFVRLAERQANKNGIVLTVARESDERRAKSAAKKALVELGMDADDLETAVDDSMIGGWRLEGRGTLVDNSYKKKLLDLYNRSIQ